MAFNPSTQPAGMVQIIKRQITDQEQSLAVTYYNSLRNGSRGMATASMFMAVLNVAIIAGALPLADMAILFTVLALVFGLAAMGIGGMTLKARTQINTAFKEGFVIVVLAPAYLNRGGGKAPMWNIGPISVMQTPEVQTILVEGAPAEVVVVPGVKAALSVNGMVLKRGATITAPPNLASMAQPSVPAPTYPPMQQQMVPQYQAPPQYQPQPAPAYQPPPQQPVAPQPQQPYVPPPQQPPVPPSQPAPYAPPQQPYAPLPQPYVPPQQPIPPPAQQPLHPPQNPPQPAPYAPLPAAYQPPQYPPPQLQMAQQPPPGQPPQSPPMTM